MRWSRAWPPHRGSQQQRRRFGSRAARAEARGRPGPRGLPPTTGGLPRGRSSAAEAVAREGDSSAASDRARPGTTELAGRAPLAAHATGDATAQDQAVAALAEDVTADRRPAVD